MDVDSWAEWMPTVSAATWEKRGAPDTGLGGIRRVGKRLNITRDHVVAGTRPCHHAYVASTPRFMLIKDYRGDIRIEESENGSLIVWTVTCTPRIAPSAECSNPGSSRCIPDWWPRWLRSRSADNDTAGPSTR